MFCLSGLCDALMCSPSLKALAAVPDRFRLTLVTMFPSVADYLREQQFSDDVRDIRFLGMNKWGIFRECMPLRRERFDVSVIPYAMNRLGYNILSRVVGADYRIGFRYGRQGVRNCPWLNQCALDEDVTLHGVQENLRWAGKLLGCDWRELDDRMVCRVSDKSLKKADEFAREQRLDGAWPLVGIHAGCNSLKNQHNRCWPAARFGELIQRLAKRWPGLRVVLLEGHEEAKMNRTVCASVGGDEGRVVVARRLPVQTVAGLIRRCQFFVSNVSGPMHVAAAIGVPVVGIYGPTNPVWDGPWKTPHVVVTRGLPCSPCFHYSSRPLTCPAGLDYACVRELPVDDVESAAARLWESVRGQDEARKRVDAVINHGRS